MPNYLYHYTSEDNYYDILDSGRIYSSSPMTDGIYGKGVYLTAVPPHVDDNYLARNNYGPKMFYNDPDLCFEKITHYFRFHIDDLEDLIPVGEGTDRNIWLYPFKFIDLYSVNYEHGER